MFFHKKYVMKQGSGPGSYLQNH